VKSLFVLRISSLPFPLVQLFSEYAPRLACKIISRIECSCRYIWRDAECLFFSAKKTGCSGWNLLPLERNAKIRLTLFVVLPRIGKESLGKREWARNSNKKRAANLRSLLSGLYPPPGTSPN